MEEDKRKIKEERKATWEVTSAVNNLPYKKTVWGFNWRHRLNLKHTHTHLREPLSSCAPTKLATVLWWQQWVPSRYDTVSQNSKRRRANHVSWICVWHLSASICLMLTVTLSEEILTKANHNDNPSVPGRGCYVHNLQASLQPWSAIWLKRHWELGARLRLKSIKWWFKARLSVEKNDRSWICLFRASQ